MQHLRRIRFLALMGIALFVLAACRAPAQTGSTGAQNNQQAGTATAAPTAGSTPTGSTPTASAPTAGAVALVLNKSAYGPNETIEVTITNGLRTMISAADHRSNCTLVQLEQLNGGAWQAEGGCRLMTPTRLIPLAPGASLLQVLAPGTGLNGTGPWPAGTYRIAFGYRTGGDGAGGTQTMAYSANFVVS